ncbi:MAG: hypothetical protein MHM6MM_003523 [Cercozoa sp. M6MM]
MKWLSICLAALQVGQSAWTPTEASSDTTVSVAASDSLKKQVSFASEPTVIGYVQEEVEETAENKEAEHAFANALLREPVEDVDVIDSSSSSSDVDGFVTSLMSAVMQYREQSRDIKLKEQSQLQATASLGPSSCYSAINSVIVTSCLTGADKLQLLQAVIQDSSECSDSSVRHAVRMWDYARVALELHHELYQDPVDEAALAGFTRYVPQLPPNRTRGAILLPGGRLRFRCSSSRRRREQYSERSDSESSVGSASDYASSGSSYECEEAD